MGDAIIDLFEGAAASPWAYPVLFAFAALDAFFPAVPSETMVITAGVFAVTGEPNLFLVIGFVSVGAFVGDHISYLIGRTAGARVVERAKSGTRRRAAFDWAAGVLSDRGGVILIVCRYIPGARTAITLTAGAVRYPLRSFSFFDGIAALSWGVYASLIGYIGGRAFENDPFKGLLLGLGFALAVTAVVELARHLRGRSRAPAVRRPARACRESPPGP